VPALLVQQLSACSARLADAQGALKEQRGFITATLCHPAAPAAAASAAAAPGGTSAAAAAAAGVAAAPADLKVAVVRLVELNHALYDALNALALALHDLHQTAAPSHVARAMAAAAAAGGPAVSAAAQAEGGGGGDSGSGAQAFYETVLPLLQQAASRVCAAMTLVRS
jgi:hypothetical protein